MVTECNDSNSEYLNTNSGDDDDDIDHIWPIKVYGHLWADGIINYKTLRSDNSLTIEDDESLKNYYELVTEYKDALEVDSVGEVYPNYGEGNLSTKDPESKDFIKQDTIRHTISSKRKKVKESESEDDMIDIKNKPNKAKKKVLRSSKPLNNDSDGDIHLEELKPRRKNPATNDLVLAINDSISATNDLVPAINDSIPAINDSIPATNDSIPAINDSIPAINDLVPATNDSASDDEIKIQRRILLRKQLKEINTKVIKKQPIAPVMKKLVLPLNTFDENKRAFLYYYWIKKKDLLNLKFSIDGIKF